MMYTHSRCTYAPTHVYTHIHTYTRPTRGARIHTDTYTQAGTKVAIARDTRAETKWPRRKRYVSPTAGHITGSTPVTQNRTNFYER